MRNIKKKIKISVVECLVYNRATKAEETVRQEMPETQTAPTAPENGVILEWHVVSTAERVYTMTPAEFIAHATAEPEAPTEPEAPAAQ